MAKIDKKYQEDFQKMEQDWERFCAVPTPANLKLLEQDLQQLQIDMKNINL
ncbi:MAG: hypothetical protein K940chlam2_01010 [Chlamydiae bacterium]|nr:hypothetical protein [Chlamydiota bacterium]